MKVIITGSTGMVGKSILLESLDDPRIEEVLVINRNSLGISNPKLKEILLQDFTKIDTIYTELIGYDAMYHCMGVSVVGQSEESYTHITYTTTKVIADTLHEINPKMTFSYVSGAGTDSSESGRSMWTRVKGKTENYILSKEFKAAYMIRLGAILPEKGIKSRTGWYNAFYIVMRPFFPLFKKSKNIITTTNFGKAMINTLFRSPSQTYLENKDLNTLAL